MITLIAVLGGLLGAIAGWVAAAALAIVLSGYFGVSDFEGQRGMAAIFLFGPMGGVIGLIAGVWIAIKFRSGGQAVGKAFARRLPVVLLPIAGLVAAVFAALPLFNPVLNPNGVAPQLAFEIKLPAGFAIPATGLDVNLVTEKNTMPATLHKDGASVDASGRPVISGVVDLYYRSGWRLIELKMPNTPEHLFVLRIGARPGHDTDFRDWERVSNVGNGTDHPRAATPADAYDIRYRVIWPE